MTKKTQTIIFRCTPEEKATLYRFATDHQIGISQAIRGLMLNDYQYLNKVQPRVEHCSQCSVYSTDTKFIDCSLKKCKCHKSTR